MPGKKHNKKICSCRVSFRHGTDWSCWRKYDSYSKFAERAGSIENLSVHLDNVGFFYNVPFLPNPLNREKTEISENGVKNTDIQEKLSFLEIAGNSRKKEKCSVGVFYTSRERRIFSFINLFINV
jgi:hypothetical protein